MTDVLMPPAFILLGAAILVALTRKTARNTILLLAPLATLVFVLMLQDGAVLWAGFLSYEVTLVEVDGMRKVLAAAFVLMLLAVMFFAMNRAGAVELTAAMAYGGAALGVLFAGDLLMLFLFWELMVIFSAIIIFAAGTEAARGAGIRYIIIQLLAGLVLKIGIEAVTAEAGTTAMQALVLEGFGAWVVAAALLINAAAVPLSVWLTDAYPEATPTGTAFLAAFTTKSAVLASAILFGGAAPLILFGLLMIVYGTFYGMREDNIRRLLCYALVSQVGFMLCGVGVGGEAVIGAVIVFAFIHVLAMCLLMLSAAAVIEVSGTESLSETGNLSARMPLVFLATALGSAGLVLAPVASGLLVSIGEAGETWLQYVLLFAATATVLHGGYKYLWMCFLRKSVSTVGTDVTGISRFGFVVPAVPLAAIILFAPLLQGLLGTELRSLFSVSQLLMLLVLCGGSALVVWLLRPLISQPESITVDVDIVYRKWLSALWVDIEHAIKLLSEAGTDFAKGPLLNIPRRWFHYHGPQGPLAKTWATGSMLMWVTVILAVLLIGARLM